MHQRGDGIDNLTLCEEIKRIPARLAEIGGAAYITRLQTCSSNPFTYPEVIRTYAQFILTESYRRKANAMASDIAKSVQNSEIPPHDIQTRIETMTTRLRTALPGESDYHAGKEAHAEYTQIIQARMADDAPENFMMYYDGFEPYVASIKPGKLVVISGLSGYGKTIFMEEWAEWLAMLGHRVRPRGDSHAAAGLDQARSRTLQPPHQAGDRSVG